MQCPRCGEEDFDEFCSVCGFPVYMKAYRRGLIWLKYKGYILK